jgi:hypothetical protein
MFVLAIRGSRHSFPLVSAAGAAGFFYFGETLDGTMFHGIRRQLFQKIFGGDVQLLIFATRFEKHGSGKRRKGEKTVGMLAKSWRIIGIVL